MDLGTARRRPFVGHTHPLDSSLFMAGQYSIAPRPRRDGSVRDELDRVFEGSAGVDEFVHGLLAFLAELGLAHPEHPLLGRLAAQLDEGANAPIVAAALHDLRSLLHGVGIGLELAPGLLERSGALLAADARPGEVDRGRLELLLEALDDARVGTELAGELAGETLRAQRDRLDSGQASAPTRLAELVETAARFVGRRVEVQVRLETPAELEVLAPRGDLLRVLLNLLRNAAQAIAELEDPTGASVRISTWASDELAFVQVADDGPGIPAATLDAIFELFFTTHGEGTGVGLFVCKTLTHRWGGMIHVDSRVGEGARFTISVPLAEPG